MGAANGGVDPGRLLRGIVLRVQEDACQIVAHGQPRLVRYAKSVPSPRTERISPGHLVAVATAADGSERVIWRWYDAVVLGTDAGLIRLWEPSHGEVVARPRRAGQQRPPGTRAYLSAGLPGADWWVAGAIVGRAEDADVELGEVERFYDERDLWNDLVYHQASPETGNSCPGHASAREFVTGSVQAKASEGFHPGSRYPDHGRPPWPRLAAKPGAQGNGMGAAAG